VPVLKGLVVAEKTLKTGIEEGLVKSMARKGIIEPEQTWQEKRDPREVLYLATCVAVSVWPSMEVVKQFGMATQDWM
jgi:hypothetical protein